jgi:hypothetical protein
MAKLNATERKYVMEMVDSIIGRKITTFRELLSKSQKFYTVEGTYIRHNSEYSIEKQKLFDTNKYTVTCIDGNATVTFPSLDNLEKKLLKQYVDFKTMMGVEKDKIREQVILGEQAEEVRALLAGLRTFPITGVKP